MTDNYNRANYTWDPVSREGYLYKEETQIIQPRMRRNATHHTTINTETPKTLHSKKVETHTKTLSHIIFFIILSFYSYSSFFSFFFFLPKNMYKNQKTTESKSNTHI